MSIEIACPRCNEERDFEEFRLLEAALLVCPNCGAEFSITATVEKLPDGEEEAPEPDAEPGLPEPELDLPPAMSDPAAELPPADLPVAASVQHRGARRRPVINVGVLACSSCKKDWVGTHVEKCPSCGASTVLASQKSVKQRAAEALDEVERGVPEGRAAAKLIGNFHGAESGVK